MHPHSALLLAHHGSDVHSQKRVACDVLALAGELAAAAERGDVDEVVRIACAIVVEGEPDALVG